MEPACVPLWVGWIAAIELFVPEAKDHGRTRIPTELKDFILGSPDTQDEVLSSCHTLQSPHQDVARLLLVQVTTLLPASDLNLRAASGSSMVILAAPGRRGLVYSKFVKLLALGQDGLTANSQ